MTKGELRRLRKDAKARGEDWRAAGRPADQFDDRGQEPVEFSESRRGRDALYRWAKFNYDYDRD